MNLLKKLATAGFVAGAMFLSSCTAETTGNTISTENAATVNSVTEDSFNGDKLLAKFVAENEIQFAIDAGNCEWTKESKVTELFPVYVAGIEGVAYYECKIMTGNENGGYVLVSNTESDILIPESVERGLTLTEKYRNALGTKEFNVLRYDWFTSAAESNTSRGLDPELLASIGIYSDELTVTENCRSEDVALYSEKKMAFEKEVIKNGAIPPYTKEAMEEYYTLKEQETGRGSPDKRVGDKTSLKNSTLRWIQSHWMPDDYPCGCGNAAWSIVYAYWHQFKGKDKLFVDSNGNSLDLKSYNTESACAEDYKSGSYIYDAQWELYSYTNSARVATYDDLNPFFGLTHKEKKSGLTLPQNMNKGCKYGNNRGYGVSLGWKSFGYHNWTDVTDFLYKAISNDKPAILLIATSGITANHYVVIEEVNKCYWRKTGVVVEVRMRANYGWGEDDNRTIYAFSDQWGRKITTSYDVFIPSVN